MELAKSDHAYRTISELSDDVRVPQHVLRFWETKFPEIKPLKRGGNRRYYRPEDVALIRAVNRLLYTEGYTIRGVQKLIKERGVRAVIAGETPAAAPEAVALPDLAGGGLSPAHLSALRSIRDRLALAVRDARA